MTCCERALVEARPHVGGETELASPLAALPVADEDGAERDPRPLAARVAADDEIGALRRLHLHPRRRPPAGLVAALLALAHHALEPARERRGLQRPAVVRGVHERHARRGQKALREVAAAIPVRRIAQVDAREIQEIEGIEGCRRRLLGGGDFPFRLQLRAVLERGEGRHAGRAERDDLAVQDHAVHRLPAELGHESRKLGRQIEPAPRAELDALCIDEREHAVAVELGLPHPVVAVERSVTRFGEHRGELRGHRDELARGHEPRRANAARGDDLEVRDRDTGEHGMVLRRDVARDREAVLVLQQQPLLRVPGAHQRERSLELLAAQEEAELALHEALADLALRVRAIVEPRRAAFIG